VHRHQGRAAMPLPIERGELRLRRQLPASACGPAVGAPDFQASHPVNNDDLTRKGELLDGVSLSKSFLQE
jgi:hypothetical protein